MRPKERKQRDAHDRAYDESLSRWATDLQESQTPANPGSFLQRFFRLPGYGGHDGYDLTQSAEADRMWSEHGIVFAGHLVNVMEAIYKNNIPESLRSLYEKANLISAGLNHARDQFEARLGDAQAGVDASRIPKDE